MKSSAKRSDAQPAKAHPRVQELSSKLKQIDPKLLGGPFERFAPALLKIQTKDGLIEPFVPNKTQLYIDWKLNKQLAEARKVRALILKGRQQGSSTYVGGRFFRRNLLGQVNTFILSHEADSTEHLFSMAKRFHEFLPPEYRPFLGKSNAKEMKFPGLGSHYRVGTAGEKATGRSMTTQLFHGSEVAHWPNAEQHLAGVLQTVPPADGTEVILETTANGIGGVFYDKWIQAEKGAGEYIAIFVPWYWQPEYQMPAPPGWAPAEEELEVAQLYGLKPAQSYWYHLKNIELGGTAGRIHWLIKQEYPNNAQEAFQAGGAAGLIRPEHVMKARKAQLEAPDDQWVPRVLGVDVARNAGEGDRTRLIDRQGRHAGKRVNLTLVTDDLMVVVHHVRQAIDEHAMDMAFIDVTGLGAGVVDRLREMGYGPKVRGINFGAEPYDKTRHRNKRAEMWWTMKEWFEDEGGASIPDDDTLHRHLCASRGKFNSNSQLVLVDKEILKKELGFSPDGGDALALTFAEKVVKHTARNRLAAARRRPVSWMAR